MTGPGVDLALGTIRDIPIGEVKFLSGVSSQVKDVQAELKQMQCFLEDHDRIKYEKQSVQNFVKEIKKLSYRIEDVVETNAAEVILKRRKMGIKDFLNRVACSSCECYSIHEVGTEINDIKTDVVNLISRMAT
ncbi:putative disease resistance protein At1g50180 [Coffea arabica]|uniref:Disease resistance protein At1g50180 n=1 Tax=Coffea arabica TaxID=13443 RepID=A0ABM4X7X7_COFAR